ncbi:MAG: UDP-glucose--hexose-1-phosphate uridylyltransferase, partial [Clostridia bacterium]|nr:UDP-glucose--hexose-1-phosphate uridylyltransferase [Clostridia bacterium]
MNKVYAAIGALSDYAISHGLAEEADRHCLVNALLEKLGLDDYETVGDVPFAGLDDILDTLVDYAAGQGLLKSESITGRDLFDTALMGVVTPRPSDVVKTFQSLYGESPEKATDWFYQFSQDTNYIRATRVAKDIRWSVPSEFGDIDISINLSKPEKDPRDIAAAKTAKQSAYPKCQLCLENEGYSGRMDHPARQNHRIIPVTINESHWGFQYSPYVYYNEHCIVLNGEHVPMKIDRAAFRKLFDFVGQFPHYFLGSNADLPIVGGSILSHDHFQGGRYEFAMAKAPYESKFTVPGYEDIEAGIVHWPLSVIRLRGEDDERIIDLADHILKAWRGYTDEAAFIFAETDGEPHNTITPIARKRDGKFELDLALRNNITTDECPLGVYHPHAEYHHIKKENIGLIEVMGLAILPARLKTEMALLAECLTGDKKLEDYPELEQHAE